jgi:hypothetical protein
MIHITERDRQLVDASEVYRSVKDRFDQALSTGVGTKELFAELESAAAEVRRIEQKPLRFVCAGCNEEEDLTGHVIYTVVAVCSHDADTDTYHWIEYPRDQMRHLVLCGDCDKERGFREHLHERKFDEEKHPHRQASAEIARLKAEIDQLEDSILELNGHNCMGSMWLDSAS